MAGEAKIAGGREKPDAGKMHVIATEEAFATPAFLKAFLKEAEKSNSPGITYPAMILKRQAMADRLCDMDVRIAEMDAAGVDMHLLSVTSPGVQVFEAQQATELAAQLNDELAAHIRRFPARLAGLATVAPQDPVRAADEIDRAIGKLGLNGIIINSHTHGEFLDDRKFDPLLEAAQRNRAPIYIHPTFPPDDMIKPFQKYGLEGALYGFAAETGLHAIRMVMGGVFERFPELQIVLGHMGESLPFFLFRYDNVVRFLNANAPGLVTLERPPSEYIKSNIHITTSGMFWDRLLQFGIDTMGIDRLIFAIDYPYESSQIACDWLRAAPISDEEKAAIFSGNARKLFRITV